MCISDSRSSWPSCHECYSDTALASSLTRDPLLPHEKKGLTWFGGREEISSIHAFNFHPEKVTLKSNQFRFSFLTLPVARYHPNFGPRHHKSNKLESPWGQELSFFDHHISFSSKSTQATDYFRWLIFGFTGSHSALSSWPALSHIHPQDGPQPPLLYHYLPLSPPPETTCLGWKNDSCSGLCLFTKVTVNWLFIWLHARSKRVNKVSCCSHFHYPWAYPVPKDSWHFPTEAKVIARDLFLEWCFGSQAWE